MKIAKRKIEEYDWYLTVISRVFPSDFSLINDLLMQIGCTDARLIEVYNHINSGQDRGLTYSNVKKRETLVILSPSSSIGEFANTTTHEMFHVVSHICEAHGIEMNGERPCYLMGNLCQWLTEINCS